jgi:hypothetical protein
MFTLLFAPSVQARALARLRDDEPRSYQAFRNMPEEGLEPPTRGL